MIVLSNFIVFWVDSNFLSTSSADGPGVAMLCRCPAEHIPGLGPGHALQTQPTSNLSCEQTYPCPASRAYPWSSAS